jgi:hypothetical protein
MGICASALEQSKQINKNDRGNAANSLQPTRRSGMGFKPVNRCRQRAYGPSYPTVPVHETSLASEISVGHRPLLPASAGLRKPLCRVIFGLLSAVTPGAPLVRLGPEGSEMAVRAENES